MSRNEFLKNLRETLSQNLDKEFVNEQIDYYDEYISSEIEKGKSEQEVINELGDPRLIAKTIKTVNNADTLINDEEFYSKNESANANTNATNGNKNTYVYSTSGIGCVITLLLLFIAVALFFKFFGYLLIGMTGLAFGVQPAVIVLFIIFLWLMLRRKY